MGIMFAGVRIARTLSVPSWDGKRLGEALEYWMARGFRDVSLDSDGVIRGIRGSRRMSWMSGFREGTDSALVDIGAATLPTTLEMSNEADQTVRIQLRVQKWPFQRSGEWEEALFRLEIIELEHLLLGAEMDTEVWARFSKAAKRFFGRGLPAELEAEISDLEVRFLITP
jgi:hypothetical protein